MQVYRILLRRTVCVQPLSCDEALLDVTGKGRQGLAVLLVLRLPQPCFQPCMCVVCICLHHIASISMLCCFGPTAGLGEPMQIAAEIRAEIEAATGCTGRRPTISPGKG